jgi:PTH1 family peptidyl-tRNA hydrolase
LKFLIAGLGNIGDEYINTRHNIGFKIVEALAEEAGASFISERLAFHTSFRLKGKTIHLIKPTTFMNLSGKAVKYWLDKLEIPKENLLVIVDDLALPFGTVRIRARGSDGNHNGLTSVEELLQTREYPRLRFGVEGNFPKGRQVNYVLGEWSAEETKLLPEKIKIACDAVKSFATIGLERTMNTYNKIGKEN